MPLAPHSSILAWKIPRMEEPGRLQSMGSLRVDTTERLYFHFLLSCVGEGNGNPLQCPCLENPRDGGAWWEAIYGVAQSWTRLKWLSSSSSRGLKKERLFSSTHLCLIETMTAGEAIIEFVKLQELRLHYIQNPFNWNAFLVFKKVRLQFRLDMRFYCHLICLYLIR